MNGPGQAFLVPHPAPTTCVLPREDGKLSACVQERILGKSSPGAMAMAVGLFCCYIVAGSLIITTGIMRAFTITITASIAVRKEKHTIIKLLLT